MIADEKIEQPDFIGLTRHDDVKTVIKWEYDIVTGGKSNEAFCKSVPGLNSWGQGGWELVTVVPSIKEGRVDDYWWVFKRPK